jgi:stage III sporulation protein SpoIIIAA
MTSAKKETKEIPRLKDKQLTEQITLWVEPELKEAYVTLKDKHRVRSAECMRIAMRQEIKRLMEIYGEPCEV